jgi:hypothetical protein
MVRGLDVILCVAASLLVVGLRSTLAKIYT